jgi:hypothetical protein
LESAWQIDAYFGTPERPIFQDAGKEFLFAYPALHIACWTKL